jgi:pectate lyase
VPSNISSTCSFFGRDNGEAAAYAGVNYAGSAAGSGGSGVAGSGGSGYGYLGMVYASGSDWSCRSHSILSLTTLVLVVTCLHTL